MITERTLRNATGGLANLASNFNFRTVYYVAGTPLSDYQVHYLTPPQNKRGRRGIHLGIKFCLSNGKS